ncbi:MAG: hypothetical protein HFI80_09305 [Lachnospiraceae bacterium]|jgi:SMC interacting uncharacterized protein involved in chromosome segregation|nr:hypothetical protein [Lachnospiraceae bacterium]
MINTNALDCEVKEVFLVIKGYLRKQLKNIEEKISEQRCELKKIQSMEQIIREKIKEIQETDINFGIFSPRIGDMSPRDKIKELEGQLKKVREDKATQRENLNALRDERRKFKGMLDELKELENLAKEKGEHL